MGLLHQKHEPCPNHDLSENGEPIFGSVTFYEFNKILGGACAAFACIVIFLHLFNHAMHLSIPGEQIKIMKVALLIPLYSIFSLLSICFPHAKVYLLPWLEVFQSMSLAAYFLLLCEYVSPSTEQRDVFFAAMTVKAKRGQASGSVDGLKWFQKRWIMIFQYPVVSLLASIATDATEAAGIYCQYETKAYFAKLWITIIQTISLVLAVMSVLMFALNLRPHMPQQNPIRKLVAFKLVVFLGFVQKILFWILDDTNALNPTDKLTYADLNMGIPSLLSCVEMVPISLLMVWAYPVRPYVHHKRDPMETENGIRRGIPQSYQGGFLGVRAFLGMMNPAEAIEGIAFAFKMVTEGKQQPPGPGFHPVGHQGGCRDDQAYLMNQR